MKYHQFTNDYSESIHPVILSALTNAIDEQNKGYGLDKHSEHAKKLILKRFGASKGDCFFVSGGTQANMTVISYLLKPYESVIACDTGHINVHETGAVEGSGHKVITVKNEDGKLTAANIEELISLHTDEHMVKPRMVYISNSTETGSIYSKAELTAIRKVCDKHNLYLFIDGARIGSALTSKANDVEPEFIGKISDVFYVGGTKNGLLSGEAIVFKNKELAKDFRWHIKNKGAMLAKGFVLGIQFEKAFEDNLYFEMAETANKMADYIRRGISKNVGFAAKSSTNQLFFEIKKDIAFDIMDKFGCELWKGGNDKVVIRAVTSFKTTKKDCDTFLDYVNKVCK